MGAFALLAGEVIARHHGVEPRMARSLYRQTSGVPFAQQLEAVFGDDPRNAAAAEEYEARKHTIAMAADMRPATRAALEGIRRRGVRLVISSNGMQGHVDAFARRHQGLFSLALGFGGGLAKGEPHVERVCQELEVARRSLLFVGDSLADASLAAQTGVGFVAKAGTFSEVEFRVHVPHAPVIRSIGELGVLF